MADEKKQRSTEKPWHSAKDEKTSSAGDLDAGITIIELDGTSGSSKRPSGDPPAGRPSKRPAPNPDRGGRPAKRPTPNLANPDNHYIPVCVGKGESSVIFPNVVEEFLTYNLPYFEKAIAEHKKSLFVETPLSIENTTPPVFDVFLNFLYKRTLKNTYTQKYPSPTTMAKLWIFADSVKAPEVQNAAIEGLYHRPGLLKMDFVSIYDQTIPGSKLRKLVIDNFTQKSTDESFTEAIEDNKGKFPPQMGFDLAIALKTMYPKPAKKLSDIGEYFVRADQ